MDKQTYQQLDQIQGLLEEIAYELEILDEQGRWIPREERDDGLEETKEEENKLPHEKPNKPDWIIPPTKKTKVTETKRQIEEE